MAKLIYSMGMTHRLVVTSFYLFSGFGKLMVLSPALAEIVGQENVSKILTQSKKS